MWIKNQYQLMAVDIKHECLVEQPDSLLATWGISSPIKDFFMDKAKNIWIINDKDELILVDKNNMKVKTFCLMHLQQVTLLINSMILVYWKTNYTFFTVPVC